MIVVNNSSKLERLESFIRLFEDKEVIRLFTKVSPDLKEILGHKQNVVVIEDIATFDPSSTKKWLREKTGNDVVFSKHQLSFLVVVNEPVEDLSLGEDPATKKNIAYKSYFFVTSPYLMAKTEGDHHKMTEDDFLQNIFSLLQIAGSDLDGHLYQDYFYVLTIAGVFLPFQNILSKNQTEIIKKVIGEGLPDPVVNHYREIEALKKTCENEITHNYYLRILEESSRYSKTGLINYIRKVQKQKWGGKIISEAINKFIKGVSLSEIKHPNFCSLNERIKMAKSIKSSYIEDYEKLLFNYQEKSKECFKEFNDAINDFDENRYKPFLKKQNKLVLFTAAWIFVGLSLFLIFQIWFFFFMFLILSGTAYFLLRLLFLRKKFNNEFKAFKNKLDENINNKNKLFERSDHEWLKLYVISELEKFINELETKKSELIEFFNEIPAVKVLDLDYEKWFEIPSDFSEKFNNEHSELISQIINNNDMIEVFSGFSKRIAKKIIDGSNEKEDCWWLVPISIIKQKLMVQKDEAIEWSRTTYIPLKAEVEIIDETAGNYCFWLPEPLLNFNITGQPTITLTTNRMALVSWAIGFRKIGIKEIEVSTLTLTLIFNQKFILMKNSGVADIAFIIDTSGSMNGVFDYLIQNLTSFVGQIQNQSKTFNQFDIRIGVIAGDNKKFFIVPFTNNYQSVVTNLKTIKKERVGGNEIMCYGIDLALIELDWRTEGRRIMVMITDEKLATNHSPKELRKGITSNLLKKRIEGMGILFYIISPECPDYEKLAEIEKSLWIPIKLSEDLKDYSLIQHIFEILNKSISKSMALKSNQRLTSIKEKDYIYLFPETDVVFL